MNSCVFSRRCQWRERGRWGKRDHLLTLLPLHCHPHSGPFLLIHCGLTHSNCRLTRYSDMRGRKSKVTTSCCWTISILLICANLWSKVPTAVIQKALQGIEPNENSKAGLSMDCTITPIRWEDRGKSTIKLLDNSGWAVSRLFRRPTHSTLWFPTPSNSAGLCVFLIWIAE